MDILFTTLTKILPCELKNPIIQTLDLDNCNVTISYQISDSHTGETVFQKFLYYDNFGKNYPSFDTWYNNYNSTQFLLDEFIRLLTDEEKAIISKK